ncbi:MAG: DUF2804 domain-containing protein [Candidatus Fimenecus sp.]
MSLQHEIKEPTLLLNSDGSVREPGWCRRNNYIYNPENIKCSFMRLKEWDFYQISDGNMMLQLNFANISYGAAATFAAVNLRTGARADAMGLKLYTPHSFRMNKNGDIPNIFYFSENGTTLSYEVEKTKRHLTYEGKTNSGKIVKADIYCYNKKNQESITICTPFDKPEEFFLTNKFNCMNAEGFIEIGKEKYVFKKEYTHAVMDWGRGVWPHKADWYWSNGSTEVQGKPFGWEFTWGFGNESHATETAIFYDGICYKLGPIRLVYPPEKLGFMKPWHFVSDDGRLDFVMNPYYDNRTLINLPGLAKQDVHQVHGLFSGTVKLDDIRTVHIKNTYAFCERVCNIW